MPHPDDGLLEEFLDGELAPAAAGELARHLEECSECRARLGAAQARADEALSLLGDLGEPPGAGVARSIPPARAAPRKRDWRPVAWAATLVIAAGLGYAGGSWRPPVVPPESQEAAQVPTADAGPTLPSEPLIPPTRPGDRAPTARESDRVATPPQVRADVPTAPGAAAEESREPASGERARQAPASKAVLNDAIAADAAAPAPALEQERRDAGQRTGQTLGVTEQAAPGRLEAAASDPGYAEAIRVLGGSIRLIDGMQPESVEVLQQGVGPDAVPAVRVRYANGIELVQWRVDRSVAVPIRIEGTMARWEPGDGFALALTAAERPAEELRALAARVR